MVLEGASPKPFRQANPVQLMPQTSGRRQALSFDGRWSRIRLLAGYISVPIQTVLSCWRRFAAATRSIPLIWRNSDGTGGVWIRSGPMARWLKEGCGAFLREIWLAGGSSMRKRAGLRLTHPAATITARSSATLSGSRAGSVGHWPLTAKMTTS